MFHFLILSSLLCLSSTADALVYYVSPDGNDSWSGTFDVPKSDGSDGPFRTLEKARDEVRKMERDGVGGRTRSVEVQVREGVYFLESPFVLTPEDSGDPDRPITYAAYPGENPVLSGGVRIPGWRKDGNVWVAEVPGIREGEWSFRDLWINGKRAVRARYPNRGYLTVGEIPDATPGRVWHQGVKRFAAREGDLPRFTLVPEVFAMTMTRWVESHLEIESVDWETGMMNFTKSSVFQLQPYDLYYLEGAPEFLDQPGEWYLDRTKGLLRYIPREGETLESVEAIAPRLPQLLRIEGDPERERYVEFVELRGLTFSHNHWWFTEDFRAFWPAPDVAGFPQAAVQVPGAIFGEGVRRCVFENLRVVHIGSYGIELARGCSDNVIADCEIGDLSAGGIKIGEMAVRPDAKDQTFRNIVRDCHVYDGGLRFHSAIGIWSGQSYENRFQHNHIHDFYYSGFSLGWTWGYGPSLNHGNVVEWNHVHHIGVRSDGDGPILSDMGGIYTLGARGITLIAHNLFHDIQGLRYGGWGIYFDEGSTHVLAENNLVYRTTHGGFHQHYGKENQVRNNVFAFARDYQAALTRPEEHLSFTFERNIVLWDKGVLFSGNWNRGNALLHGNLYWFLGEGEIPFGTFDWPNRQSLEDPDSLIADPLFVNVAGDDYRLREGSPAWKIGFIPLDLCGVGIRNARHDVR